MKPAHVMVAVAVIAVGAIVYLMNASSGDRGSTTRTEGTNREANADGLGGTGGGGEDEGADAKAASARQGTLALSAKIIGTDGKPAAGAKLEVFGVARLEATADDDGAVTVEELAPGFYLLIASKGEATASKTIELKATTDAGELVLGETVTVSGFVYDERNKPIEGAAVEAVVSKKMRGFDMSTIAKLLTEPGDVAARATTGEDGAYRMRVPKGGTFGLRATASGRAQEGDAARTYAASAENINFYLFPGVSLAGRVIDPKERPVPGARVMILNPLSIFGQGAPKIETTTGIDGSFALSVTPQEQSLMVVRAPGYASHMQDDLKVPAPEMLIRLETGIVITLRTVRKGEEQIPAPGVNVGVMYNGNFALGVTGDDGRLSVPNIPAKRSGGMGGSQSELMLWGGGFVPQQTGLRDKKVVDGVLDVGNVPLEKGGVIKGKIVDKETGDPIAGVEVRALGGSMREAGLFGAARATSKKDGTYELEGVPLNATILLAQHPDYQLNENPMALMMSGRGGGKALFPEGEDELEKDIALAKAAVVTGIVVAPDGTPVSGADVIIRDEMMLGMAMMLGMGGGRATTDGEGRFTVGGLTPGQNVPLVAMHRDWGASSAKRGRAGDPDITIKLSPPLTIRGKVKDEAGDPVAGARISVQRANQSRRRGFNPFDAQGATRPGVSDDSGSFVIRNAPVGKLQLHFAHPRFTEKRVPLDVNASQREKDVGEIVLARGNGISGVVIGVDGRPLANARVNAQYQHAPGAGKGEGRTWGDARTDAEGRFEIFGLREGEFSISVTANGMYAPAVKRRTGSTDVRVEMRTAGKIVGVAVDPDGQPVVGANAYVEVANERGDLRNVGWQRTDDKGMFTIDSLPPDQDVVLRINHDAYKQFRAVTRTSPSQQRYTLDPGARVEGHVYDEAKRPVANAQIYARQGNTGKNVQTDGTGRFVAGGFAPEGEITVQLRSSDRNYIQTEPIAVAPGTRNIELIAREGEQISGSVVDGAGNAVSRVQVAVMDGDKLIGQTWVWQEDGTFTVGGLPKGVYTLRVTSFDNRQPNEEPKFVDQPGVATGSENVEITFTK